MQVCVLYAPWSKSELEEAEPAPIAYYLHQGFMRWTCTSLFLAARVRVSFLDCMHQCHSVTSSLGGHLVQHSVERYTLFTIGNNVWGYGIYGRGIWYSIWQMTSMQPCEVDFATYLCARVHTCIVQFKNVYKLMNALQEADSSENWALLTKHTARKLKLLLAN